MYNFSCSSLDYDNVIKMDARVEKNFIIFPPFLRAEEKFYFLEFFKYGQNRPSSNKSLTKGEKNG
jgi:hypothetical protein